MHLRHLVSLVTAASLLTFAPAAQTITMSVDEVRPGMEGVGRTVFQNGDIEEFKVHILGVLKNVVGPRRDLVLARLEGGPLAQTGVIAGMSGSPVYVGGRLLGAVSYALGQFPKEPIAGITPIAEMTDATALTAPASGSRPVGLTVPFSARELIEVWARDLGQPLAIHADAARTLLAGRGGVATDAPLLTPIAVPLVAAGFAEGVLAPLTGALVGRGFLPVSAGAQPVRTASTAAPRLRPGDAMGVALLNGDFVLGATGTVTHVDGDKVYGFGHPMYNLGPTEFPLTEADVHVVLPSLMQSSKLASFGRVIGTVQQDRATAVAGHLGSGPKMIPMSLTLNSDRVPSRTFTFEAVRDHTFTPLLTYLAVANVLTSYERGAGPASFTVRGTATIREHGDLTFEDIFAGDQPAGDASAYIAGPITQLLKNAAQPVDVEKIAITIDATEQARRARIERVWIDPPRPRPGTSATVNVLLRTFTGAERREQVTIAIPPSSSGPLQLLVSDAVRAATEDRRSVRSDTQEATQLIRAFNRSRRNNRLYVRLSASADGALVNGEPLPGLPASVLAVIEADRTSGTGTPLRAVTRGEWEVSVPLAITGSRQLTITLDQP